MGFFNHDDENDRQAYEQVQQGNEAHFSHELLAGAASFYAMKKYQDHQEENGKPQSWEVAKDLIAGFAGMEATKLAETKGADEVDKWRAKHEAEERAKHALSQSGEFGNPGYQRQEYNHERHGPGAQNFNNGYGGGLNNGFNGERREGPGGYQQGGFGGQGFGGPDQGYNGGGGRW